MTKPSGREAQRRLSAGRLAALLGLAVLGILAFLLLLDVVYNQDDPRAPWFTGQMSKVVAASVLMGTMALALAADIALLLPPRRRPAPWSPGVTCTNCGAWTDGPARGACSACGNPLAP